MRDTRQNYSYKTGGSLHLIVVNAGDMFLMSRTALAEKEDREQEKEF